MIKKDLAEASGSPATKEAINDNQLAILFKNANKNCLIEEKNEIFDIVQHTKDSYIHISNEPNEYLRKQITKTITDKKIVHEKLLNAKKIDGTFNKLINKLKTFFFPKSLVYDNSSGPLIPMDWSYYLAYSKIWKKQNKAYINDFYSWTELIFKNAEKFKSILQTEFLFFISALFTSVILFTWNNNLEISSQNTTPIGSFLYSWRLAVFVLTIIGLIILIMPYALLATMWFININHIYKSKHFHYWLIFAIILAYSIFLISIFNLSFFQFLNWKYDLQ